MQDNYCKYQRQGIPNVQVLKRITVHFRYPRNDHSFRTGQFSLLLAHRIEIIVPLVVALNTREGEYGITKNTIIFMLNKQASIFILCES